jgi:hypothetical protein
MFRDTNSEIQQRVIGVRGIVAVRLLSSETRIQSRVTLTESSGG